MVYEKKYKGKGIEALSETEITLLNRIKVAHDKNEYWLKPHDLRSELQITDTRSFGSMMQAIGFAMQDTEYSPALTWYNSVIVKNGIEASKRSKQYNTSIKRKETKTTEIAVPPFNLSVENIGTFLKSSVVSDKEEKLLTELVSIILEDDKRQKLSSYREIAIIIFPNEISGVNSTNNKVRRLFNRLIKLGILNETWFRARTNLLLNKKP